MNFKINLDYGLRIPIYEQIVNNIERLISLEILKANEQIPSIRDLAYNLGVNPNTVKKAYDILEEKGSIVMKSTKGTFIADDVSKTKDKKIEELIKEINEKVRELKNIGISLEDIIRRIK